MSGISAIIYYFVFILIFIVSHWNLNISVSIATVLGMESRGMYLFNDVKSLNGELQRSGRSMILGNISAFA
jgi:hypothetical protein